MVFSEAEQLSLRNCPPQGDQEAGLAKWMLHVEVVAKGGRLVGLSLRDCPPQGNLGGGVDEAVDLQTVANGWRVDLGRSPTNV